MKLQKKALFVLAGAWILLMVVEKWSATADVIMTHKRSWPIKAGHTGVRSLKAVLLAILAVLNIFMALSLMTGKEQ